MDTHIVRQFGFLLAEQARIEGMKAANQARAVAGDPPQYSEHDFYQVGFAITEIARNI